jgi:hypothetical protein
MFSKTNLRIFLLFGIIVLVLPGCAGKKAFWGNEKTGFIFNYRLPQDQRWKYEAVTKQNSTQEVMGQSYESTTDIVANYTIKGVGLDKENNITSQVIMDSISIVTESRQGELKPDLSAIIGKNFGLTFSSKGKKVGFSDPESIKVSFGPMGGERSAESFFRDLFPKLPENPIKIGDSWTVDDERTEPQGGLNINIKTETVNTLAGLETLDNVECLKIATKTTGTLDGKGKQMGMDVDFEGDLDGSSVWYYAFKEGAFVKATSENVVEGTAALTGPQNLTVPVIQETKSEVKLVR